jgi:protein-tyrosine kinase
MSLVEKTLRKIQDQRRGATDAAASGTADTVAVAEPLLEAPPLPQIVSRDRPAAITIDKEVLRAAGLYPPAEEEQRLAHEFRSIKRPLIRKAMGRDAARVPKGFLIMVGSAMAGEGKSFTAVNLALSMSLERDVEVVLVDADIPKPQLTKVFGLASERGLLDVLRDPELDVESVIRPTDVPKLSFLPAGVSSGEATELLSSQRMEQVAMALGEHNRQRVVLLDTPPLLQTTESSALAQIAGQIVVVVRAESTPQPVLLDALKTLHGHPSVSLVLNQSARSANSAYYYYGYGQSEGSGGTPPL